MIYTEVEGPDIRVLKNPKGLVEIQEYERGVLLRFGKSKGVLQPGLHPAIPIVDEVRIVDLRPRMYKVGVSVISKDLYPLDTKVTVRYKIDDAEKRAVKSPVTFTEQIGSLMSAEAAREICKDTDMTVLLASREVIADAVQGYLTDHTGDWGVDIETVYMEEVNPPENVTELQKELYTAEMRRIIEPILAEARAKVYATERTVQLDMQGRYFNIASGFIERLSKALGRKEARDAVYVLFGDSLEDAEHPVAEKIRTKLHAEGMGEGAKTASEIVKTDPKFPYLMEALSKGIGIFNIGSFKDLDDLDKKLHDTLFRK